MAHSIGFRTFLVATSLLCPLATVSAQEAASDQSPAAATVRDAEATDIIVTAQRREQALLDVPVSVAVVSSEALADSNFTTVADIQFLSPGVNYNANFGGGFNVRGVGTQSLLMTAEQSVAVVIDDVIQSLPEVSFAGPSYQSLVDIQRVEVLKGPQGTLFGKNSSAGVIHLVTANPESGASTAFGSISYASNNEINAEGVANLPIGDTMALRIATGFQKRDGFVTNRFNNKDLWAYERFSLRGKLLWEPIPDLRVLLSAEYRSLEDDANGLWTLRNCGSGFGTFSPCRELAAFGVVPSPKNLAVAVEGANYTEQTSWAFSGRIDYDLGNATLTSITAYRDLVQPISLDTDGTTRAVYSRNENESGGNQFTQELRINGDVGAINYTLGAFYHESTPYQKGLNGGTLNLLPDNSPIFVTLNSIGPFANQGYGSWVKADISSWAVFGQVEAQVLENLTLIAGGRYTSDVVRQTIDYFDIPWLCRVAFASGGACHTTPLPLSSGEARVDADKFTYKLTAKYDLSDNANVYATYATGYKGPMISHPANRPQLLLRPETSEAFEVGLKASLFEKAVNLNLSAFQVDYKDFQGQQRVGVAPVFFYTTTNAGGLKTSGIEGDVTWRATPELTLGLSAAYVPTEFTEFAVQCFDRYTNPATPVGECTYVQPGLPAGSPAQFNAAGYPLIYSPELTWGVSLDYQRPISGDRMLSATATYNYRGETYGIVADPNTLNPGFGLLNAQVSLSSSDDRWKLSVFGRNLLDEYFVAGIFRTPLDAGTYNSTPLSTIGYSNIPAMDASRTFGVKLGLYFGD